MLISIPCGKSEYSFHVLESDLIWWKKVAPSTLYDVDCYMDNVPKEEKIKLLKNIEKTYDFLLSLQTEMCKLNEKKKDVFEKEINKKENEYYSKINQSRKEKIESTIAESKKELDKKQHEIVSMLKQAIPKIESLLKYDTFEGELLLIQKPTNRFGIAFDITDTMDCSKEYEFYYETSSGVGLGYNRGKGFLFIYGDGQPCTSVCKQYGCAYDLSRVLKKNYDEIIQVIDHKVDTIIKSHREVDRETKPHYKF